MNTLREALQGYLELRRSLFTSAGNITLQLDDVHAVGGESAERLVKRRRNIAHGEQQRREHFLFRRIRVDGLARNRHEHREVVA